MTAALYRPCTLGADAWGRELTSAPPRPIEYCVAMRSEEGAAFFESRFLLLVFQTYLEAQRLNG